MKGRIKYKKIKRSTYNFNHKLYTFLRNNPENIIIKKLYGNTCGLYDHATEEIIIDYRKDIIPTLVHEFIHHLHNDWKESKVIKKEIEIMIAMSPHQCRNILRILGDTV